jgi:hypothetical protein
MSTASTKTSMLAVVGPVPLRTTVQAGVNYTRQHANLRVPGQIVSGLVWRTDAPHSGLESHVLEYERLNVRHPHES